MKARTHNFLTLLIIAAVSIFSITLASCSDDDEVVKVDFNADTVEGTWKVQQMDSIMISTTATKDNDHRTFQSITYTDRYISFEKAEGTSSSSVTGEYNIYDLGNGANGTSIVEHGTYTVVTSSFRIDLSSGKQLHWLKSDGNSMTLESYNANTATRRARYTLQRVNN